MLGLCFCARAFSSCGKWGPLFIAVCGPFPITASLVAAHRLQTRRLSSCGSRAQLLHGMWDLPRPGLEPVSPALAGRFSTTAPPGKPQHIPFQWQLSPELLASPYLYKNKIYILKHSRKPQSHSRIHTPWNARFIIMSLFVLGINSAESAVTPTGAFAAWFGQQLINNSTHIKGDLLSVVTMHINPFCDADG